MKRPRKILVYIEEPGYKLQRQHRHTPTPFDEFAIVRSDIHYYALTGDCRSLREFASPMFVPWLSLVNSFGDTPLRLAALNEHFNAVRLLIKMGSPVYEPDNLDTKCNVYIYQYYQKEKRFR